ncbi:predicted protein [Thalassiosira pseudonana CCMP1335]|uniref:Ribosomal RNA methyltransferase FtsJ domain-containing protein n=1 Tax=Thalassiosira pseudonana TaxID=35128 RepID=B8C0H1_THAPS|nr:predicted protein [Thalassiosira pseudonana CCMP1335]EED93517.1 predicted protein [Thalassiosira pseudonana CCMP1335]
MCILAPSFSHRPPTLTMYLHQRLSNNSDEQQQQYALLVHKQYADRVRDALIPPNNGWIHLGDTPTSSDGSDVIARAIQNNKANSKYTMLPTLSLDEKGVRKSLRGFSLMLLQGCIVSPADLPPMARKQISWARKLTHQTSRGEGRADEHELNESEAKCANFLMLKSSCQEIWKELSNIHEFDITNDSLRIDIHPKTFNYEACLAMQMAARASINTDADESNSDNECNAEGPIHLTRSATNATNVVNIVLTSTSEQTCASVERIYWGVCNNNEQITNLNDVATREIVMETTDSQTGHDLRQVESGGVAIPLDTPVSRAYYKLAQLFDDDDILQGISETNTINPSQLLSHGAGMDVGASPGGWTQVLHNTLHIPTIVSIDLGVLAQRVLDLPGVYHLRADMCSAKAKQVMAHHAPYSVIVCDACIDSYILIEKIVDTFQDISALLKNSGGGDNANSRSVFSFPLCIVLTLKLPYKTTDSISRNLEKALKYIPDHLRSLVSIDNNGGDENINVDVKYKVVHLFANSISERTLVALFHKK